MLGLETDKEIVTSQWSVVGAQLDAGADKSYMSGLTADQRKVLGSMTSEQLSEFKQFGDRVTRDTSFVSAVARDSSESRELASRLGTTAARSERAQAAYSERAALVERLTQARERGEAISIDIAQDPYNLDMFLRYAERYGGQSASARSMLDAELARQAARPSNVGSVALALPFSFDDIRARYEAQTASDGLQDGVDAAAKRNQQRVSAESSSLPRRPSTTDAPATREEIRRAGASLRQKAEQASQASDPTSEVVRDPDGTVASRRSLMTQAGKQVGKDASAALDEAKEIVRRGLKKTQ